jgi:hypothetical protein
VCKTRPRQGILLQVDDVGFARDVKVSQEKGNSTARVNVRSIKQVDEYEELVVKASQMSVSRPQHCIREEIDRFQPWRNLRVAPIKLARSRICSWLSASTFVLSAASSADRTDSEATSAYLLERQGQVCVQHRSAPSRSLGEEAFSTRNRIGEAGQPALAAAWYTYFCMHHATSIMECHHLRSAPTQLVYDRCGEYGVVYRHTH